MLGQESFSDMSSDMSRDLGMGLRLFGRRYSRKLSLKQRHSLNLWLTRYGIPLPLQQHLLFHPRTLFNKPVRSIWLEIGFGTGEHLLSLAQMYPDIGMIGCDVFVNGILRLLRQVERYEVWNIRIFMDDAARLLDVLEEGSIGGCCLLFPDPWPKRRHHKRRFLKTDNLDKLARVMSDGAQLCLASDESDLVVWMLQQTTEHGSFLFLGQSQRRCTGCSTMRYEQKALSCGRKPLYLLFQRIKRET